LINTVFAEISVSGKGRMQHLRTLGPILLSKGIRKIKRRRKNIGYRRVWLQVGEGEARREDTRGGEGEGERRGKRSVGG
jgi:hypothetical protein